MTGVASELIGVDEIVGKMPSVFTFAAVTRVLNKLVTEGELLRSATAGESKVA